MLSTLLRLSRAIRRNRWGRLGPRGQGLVVLGGVLACVGVAAAGDSILRPDLAGLQLRVGNWAFWCMTTAALIFAYTSFEVMYRGATARRLERLPVDSGARYWWQVIEVYRRHLPIVLLPILSGMTLLGHGEVGLWLQGVGACAGALIWGLAAAVFAHVWAGTTMLGDKTDAKAYLAQGFGPPETAFLFYSPAMALVGALSVGMLTDLALGTWVTQGLWKPFAVVSGGLTVAAAVALTSARRSYAAAIYQIAPTFRGAEVLPPWREGELPRRYLGQGLIPRVPERLRPLLRRALLQYRRRFRIVPVLMTIAPAIVAIYAFRTAGEVGGPGRVAVVALSVGVLLFIPVFRAAGPELGARYDARALPVDPADATRIQWILAAIEWAPLLVLTSLAALLAFGATGLLVLAALSVGFVATHALAIPLALRVTPDVGRVALPVRAALLFVVGVLGGLT